MIRPAACQRFDIIVIGGGPAGSMAAYTAAEHGASVLLVEKSSMPRSKVCGCCLNQAALTELQRAGLGSLVEDLHAVPLERIELHYGSRRINLRLPPAVSLSRTALDNALLHAARQCGAVVRTHTRARMIAPGTVELCDHGCVPTPETVEANWIILATGLGGGDINTQQARLTDSEDIIRPGSRMGAGTILDSDRADWVRPGTVCMACARNRNRGYVGLVQLEDGRLDIGAAFDPQAVRAAGGPGPLAQRILDESHLPPMAGLSQAKWRGASLLTRHPRRVSGPRFLRVGDAAGFVEPFTGEGIAWALASGRAAANQIVKALHQGRNVDPADVERQWMRTHRSLLASHMRKCRLVSQLLRRELAMSLFMRVTGRAPRLGDVLVSNLHRPLRSFTPPPAVGA